MIGPLLSLVLALNAAPDPGAPQAPPLAIAPDPAAGHRPLLRVADVLDDPALAEAVRSGLPLRLRFRVELWKDGFFDGLEGSETWTVVLLYQPLEERYVVRAQADPAFNRRFAAYAAAREAVERTYSPQLGPREPGRYYYTAELEVETLSLSDLEELEHWLKGELSPAVRGERSVPDAIGQGVKRLFIRMLRLPARRHTARSDPFRVH